MTTDEIARRVWMETRLLQPLRPPDGTLDDACMLIARLVAADRSGVFRLAEPLPGSGALEAAGAALAAASVHPGDPEPRLLLWGSDAAGTPAMLPPPWNTLPPGAVAARGTYFTRNGRFVTLFARAEATDVAGTPVFISSVTGTGAPAAYAPVPTEGRIGRSGPATVLTLLGATLLLLAAVWAIELGAGLRQLVTLAMANPPHGCTATSCADGNVTEVTDALTRAWRVYSASASTIHLRAQHWVLRASRSAHAFHATVPLVLMAASMAVLLAAAGVGVTGRAVGALIDVRNRLSLTLVQLAGWSVILLPGVFIFGFLNVGTSGMLMLPALQPELWGVLGLAGLTPVVSRQILGLGNSILGDPDPAKTAEAAVDGTARSPETPIPASLDRNLSVEEARPADLFVSEAEGTQGTVDVNRVQFFALTLVLMIAYAATLLAAVGPIDALTLFSFRAHADQALFTTMPSFGGTALTILTATHAALLGGKLLARSGAKPAVAPER